MQRAKKLPLIVKLLLVVFLSPLIFLYALGYAVVAVAQKRPGRAPAFAVATWGIPVGEFSRVHGLWTIPLLILPFVVAWVAGIRQLARVYVPCRTTAWAMLWSIPVGFILLRVWPHQPLVGVVAAIFIALAILGWRLARAMKMAATTPTSG